MAYYTGTANDMTALRQALIDACTLEGWAWDGVNEVLSKGTLFLRLQVASGYLTLLGRTSATAGAAPNVVRIGQLQSTPVTWPAGYEIFAFPGEVYMVVNYSVDLYQWCAFGQSTVSGLPGTGMFFAASLASRPATGGIEIYGSAGDAYSMIRVCPALMWSGSNYSPANDSSWQSGANYHLHSDLDGHGWSLCNLPDTSTSSGMRYGVSALSPLMDVLPNNWSSEAVLLPIRCWKGRPSNKISLTADLVHARYTRVDNYAPGQIVTLGSDRWKIFPWYRKDTANRNGGAGINHTGTFGWAILYEGP